MATEKTCYMNIYRSGWFHREGKPNTLDRHAGDLYDSREQAMADIDPPSHYIATVPVQWTDPDDGVAANPADSVPIPLSVSRKRFRETEEVVA